MVGGLEGMEVSDRSEDNDDTPDEEILAGIKQGMKEALSGQTIPLSEMWVGIDVD
ncbi:MAG: hypothetical protein AAGN15_11775 [Cyanobacteria bacterium J06581_3]